MKQKIVNFFRKCRYKAKERIKWNKDYFFLKHSMNYHRNKRIVFSVSKFVALVGSLNNIMQAIETNDSDALLSVFSKQAITESPQIKAEIEQFLKDFPDEKLTWDRIAEGSEGSNSSGVMIDKIYSAYDISSSSGTYTLALIRWSAYHEVTDPEFRDTIGVYTMRMIDSADYQEQFDSLYDASLEIPGVYYKPSRLYSE